MENALVSIITPCYNGAKYLKQCIESVKSQTFSNWEMIIVDDCSSDDSANIVKKYCLLDSRIKYYKTNFPSGSPTKPRNLAIGESSGRFIAFLDCDDVWHPQKLEEQLACFNNQKIAIVFSNYDKINEKGQSNSRVVRAPLFLDYNTLLKGNVIGCLTGIYDSDKVGKIYLEQYGHEDYVLWLTILMKGYTAVNTGTVLASYRVSRQSISSNKIRAAKWTWNIYNNILGFSFMKSLYYFTHYAVKSYVKFLK